MNADRYGVDSSTRDKLEQQLTLMLNLKNLSIRISCKITSIFRIYTYVFFTFARFYVTSTGLYVFSGTYFPGSFGFWSTTATRPVPSAFVTFRRTWAPCLPFGPSSVDCITVSYVRGKKKCINRTMYILYEHTVS